MSDNIPSEIQEEIIKRINPVKHLLRFRTVSKQWKSLIDSPEFIALHHSINQTRAHHNILIKYNKLDKYVSVVDDDIDSYPQHKFYLTAPPTVNNLPSLRPGSHGLVCSCGYIRNGHDYMIVVWNPSIRKSFSVVMSGDRLIAFGFGVCPNTHDIKIVKVTNPSKRTLKAEVFALSTGVWRTMSINPCLRVLSFGSLPRQVIIDGIIYWASSIFGGSIVKFDLISEEFEHVDLHGRFRRPVSLFIYKPTESLALLYNNKETMLYEVWKMIKSGDSKILFEKLYSFYCNSSVSYSLEGFRMNGQPIMMQYPRGTLKVYDPSSRRMNDLLIDVDGFDYDSLMIASYTESLFMLNQPETTFQ